MVRPLPLGRLRAQLGYRALRSTPTDVYFAQSPGPMGLSPLLHLLVATRDGNLDAIDIGIGPDPEVPAAIIVAI